MRRRSRATGAAVEAGIRHRARYNSAMSGLRPSDHAFRHGRPAPNHRHPMALSQPHDDPPRLSGCLRQPDRPDFLGIAWELRTGTDPAGRLGAGFKVLPLLAALFGILHGKRYTYKWSSLLILLYFAEGLVRRVRTRDIRPMAGDREIGSQRFFSPSAVTFLRQNAAPMKKPRQMPRLNRSFHRPWTFQTSPCAFTLSPDECSLFRAFR